MNDLEICKRIAEIEGISYKINKGRFIRQTVPVKESKTNRVGTYNPLRDNDLCFRLMVKYRVDMDFIAAFAEIFQKGRTVASQSFRGGSPNRAICLAIIEANK